MYLEYTSPPPIYRRHRGLPCRDGPSLTTVTVAYPAATPPWGGQGRGAPGPNSGALTVTAAYPAATVPRLPKSPPLTLPRRRPGGGPGLG